MVAAAPSRRYSMLEEVGEGVSGRVYRAHDRLNDRVVALKRLRLVSEDEEEQAEHALALAREFRLIAALRHPNLVSVFDFGFGDDGVPYFTMEFQREASDLRGASRAKSRRAKLELIVQALRALAYIHRAGVLHRDLKPENLLVVDGELRVVDFGFSLPVAEVDSALGTFTGTPAYAAPEIYHGFAPSVASDLFSIGAVAYELLSGDVPPRGIASAAVDQDALDAGTPALVRQLLAEAPADRPRDASAAIVALGEELEIQVPYETTVIRESFLRAAPLVGRDEEIESLEARADAAASGHGCAIALIGESGAGKSRLAAELRTRALVRGLVVVEGQSIEDGAPYQPWTEVLRMAVIEAGELDERVASPLKPVIEDLEGLLGRSVADPPPLEGDAAQVRFTFAVESLFASLPRPMLVMFEDLQWAGSESLALFAHLAGMTRSLPLQLVGVYRSEDEGDVRPLLGDVEAIEIERLGRRDVARLVRSMMGELAAETALVDFIVDQTEGLPFFIVEVVRELAQEAGALDRIQVDGLPETVRSGGMRRLIRRRLERVPEAVLPMLRLAAVVGREVDLGVLDASAEERMPSWLDPCFEAQVISGRDGALRFVHDKLREQLLADLDDEEAIELHRRVALGIEATYPEIASLFQRPRRALGRGARGLAGAALLGMCGLPGAGERRLCRGVALPGPEFDARAGRRRGRSASGRRNARRRRERPARCTSRIGDDGSPLPARRFPAVSRACRAGPRPPLRRRSAEFLLGGPRNASRSRTLGGEEAAPGGAFERGDRGAR